MQLKRFQSWYYYGMLASKLFLILYVLFMWSTGGFKAWEMALCILAILPSLMVYLLSRPTKVQANDRLKIPSSTQLTLIVYPMYLIVSLQIMNWKIIGIDGFTFWLMLGSLALLEAGLGLISSFRLPQELKRIQIIENYPNIAAFIGELKEQVADDLEGAMAQLKEYLHASRKAKKLQTEIYQHQGILKRVDEEYRQGLMTTEEHQAAVSRRSQAFLELLNEVEKMLSS